MLVSDCEKSLQILMLELGRKMPHYCRSLLRPDHDILNYLQQSTDKNDRLEDDVLLLERILSPFLILVVCEKVYIEHALQDHAATLFSTDVCKIMYETYNQVLTDFDCLISLLNGMSDNVSMDEQCDTRSASMCDLQLSGVLGATTAKNTATCAAKVHRRTTHIIGDFCTLIGMRLATLDVLNSIDDNADAAASLTQTLDRIIACSKQVMSRHTCPLIERASSEARALRKYFLTHRALLENRYADATLLLFEYKQLLHSLDAAYSPLPASFINTSRRSGGFEKMYFDNENGNGSNKPYDGSKDTGTGIQDYKSVAVTESMIIINSGSNNSLDERKNVLGISSGKEAKEHSSKSAMFLLLSSFLEKLKLAHSSIFKDILDYSSALISTGTIDRSHAAASLLYNDRDVGSIQQSIQGFGILESRIPSIFIKSPNSSSSSSSSDSDAMTRNNKHDVFFKGKLKIAENQFNFNDANNYCGRLFHDIPRNGFICPIRSKWTSTHTTLPSNPTSEKATY